MIDRDEILIARCSFKGKVVAYKELLRKYEERYDTGPQLQKPKSGLRLGFVVPEATQLTL